ncbi:hypothetical protein [Methylococcus geothermalis]|uniref:Uncharacterized protein n=1 Tax=Methylococcus geothermalis TaxID=2681310 RepID=A0A858Q900_9GAMM|nr:hypothetical protein [Methylococcus geothermalis]QJD30329.1 hypothetical protein GNH96_10325 [Methylococcus geothermalis]
MNPLARLPLPVVAVLRLHGTRPGKSGPREGEPYASVYVVNQGKMARIRPYAARAKPKRNCPPLHI